MTIGFDGIRTVDKNSPLSYYDRLTIASLGMEYPRDTFMVYSPNSTDDRGMSWLLSIANVHNKTPYKAYSKWRWRNRSGIYTDLHRHGVKVYHGLDSILPTGKNKDNVKMVITVRDLTFKRFVPQHDSIVSPLLELRLCHLLFEVPGVVSLVCLVINAPDRVGL